MPTNPTSSSTPGASRSESVAKGGRQGRAEVGKIEGENRSREVTAPSSNEESTLYIDVGSDKPKPVEFQTNDQAKQDTKSERAKSAKHVNPDGSDDKD